MTEVSHAEVDPRSFDHLRGRAIHIHDEMVYADASAFYGMNAMWDKKTHAEHFAGRGGEEPNAYLTEEDTIVLADNDTEYRADYRHGLCDRPLRPVAQPRRRATGGQQ